MPIQIITEKRHHTGKPDLTYPAVFCDYCGVRITDHKQASVNWKHPMPPDDAPNDAYYENRGTPVFLCKQMACVRGWEAEHGHLDLWMDLACFAIYLPNNIEIEVKPRKGSEAYERLETWNRF